MTSKRNLLIFFASIIPKDASKKKIQQRKFDYTRSLELISLYSKFLDYEIRIVENTLGSIASWESHGLPTYLGIEYIFSPTNSGEVNKGIGELEMANLIASKSNLTEYEKIIWFSGRHLLTTESTLKNILISKAGIVVSNPDFYFIDGKIITSEKNGMFNDMLFAMNSNSFALYLEFFKKNKYVMLSESISSEELLFKFVQESKEEVEYLHMLGLLRRENKLKFRKFETSEWHFC